MADEFSPIQADSTNQAMYSNWVAPDPSMAHLYRREHIYYAPSQPGQTTNYTEHTQARDPWIISCEDWFNKGQYIALTLNPESIDFSLPLRVASETTHAAKFVYMWRRRRTDSVNGGFQISFQLSSGNILPTFDLSSPAKVELAKKYTGVGASYAPSSIDMAGDATHGNAMYRNANVSGLYDRIVPLGVQNLYAMLALADERRIRTAYSAENKPTGQTANRIVMGISTLVFPRMLLYGWIAPEGISVSMSADNPSEFTISFTLIVTSTTPKIGYDGYQSLVSSYKNNMFTQSTTLDWMAATVPSSDRSVAAGIRAAGKPPDPPMADPSSAGGNNHMLDDTISTSSSTTSV